jgi:hypothetical protein
VAAALASAPAGGQPRAVDQRRTLWENLPALLEPWVLDKVDGYFGRSKKERPAYVDQVLETIAQWRGVNSLRPQADNDHQAQDGCPSLMTMLYQRIDAIQEDAGPAERQRVGQFLTAVQARWFLRAVQGVLPKRR